MRNDAETARDDIGGSIAPPDGHHNLFGKALLPYDVLCAVYVVLALCVLRFSGSRFHYELLRQWRFDVIFLELAGVYILIDAALIALKLRRSGTSGKLFDGIWRSSFFEKYLTAEKLIRLTKIFLWLKIVLLLYCDVKQAIPAVNSTLHDPALALMDRFLTFGFNPNKLLVDFLGGGISAGIFDKLYVLWYALKPIVLVYFAVVPPLEEHTRFFTAYFAMWIFGGLTAVLIPSLGPIYVYPEWFSKLQAPIASRLQDQLARHYYLGLIDPEHARRFIYEGIAAFPSLHVGIIALFAFFLWERSRMSGGLMFAYLAAVQIGSTLLGWHYSVDGIFGIFMAYLFYRLTRFFPSGSTRQEKNRMELTVDIDGQRS